MMEIAQAAEAAQTSDRTGKHTSYRCHGITTPSMQLLR